MRGSWQVASSENAKMVAFVPEWKEEMVAVVVVALAVVAVVAVAVVMVALAVVAVVMVAP